MTRTGQQVILSGSKSTSLYHQRKKPALLRWTQAWRRHHKKANVEGGVKRKTRRVIKVQRSYVGLGVDEVRENREPLHSTSSIFQLHSALHVLFRLREPPPSASRLCS